MIEIINKENCSGCSACAMVCPKKCIKMEKDNEGFFYPIINKNLCINCNRCSNICPILNKTQAKDYHLEGIVCCSKNEDIRKNSTSGGFFAELARMVLKENGIVYGVLYDEKFLPKHECIKTLKELKKICRSKYIQSNINESYKEVKKYLETDKLVLFSGTPCQIMGLKNYLSRDYDNLITCDVVCRGVISPLLWIKHLNEIKYKYNSEIEYIGFREKFSSFHKTRLIIRLKNGKFYAPSTDIEWISRFFSLGICLRPSCYKCAFKGLYRVSDFTMFDCWDLSRLVESEKDDDKGYTNVLLHTKKAKKYLDKIKSELIYWQIDVNKAKKYDGVMIDNCVNLPINRKKFFDDIPKYDVKKLGEIYAPIPLKVWVKEKIKNIMIKFKMLKY